MNCDDLDAHLETCAVCRRKMADGLAFDPAHDMADLGTLWERLGDLPAPEPSRALDARWYATLESASRRPRRWWPAAAGLALASLALAVAAGEIVRLRGEIESTRAMVAVSLLQQQSASQRLRGIDYSGRMAQLAPEVERALIDAVSHDPSTNVRLAAIDALGRVAGEGTVAESLAGSLRRQDSPMVQAALIDYLADTRDPRVIGTLRDFEKRPDLNPAVLGRAEAALTALSH